MSNSSDPAIERQQVEWVFGLTGGELEDKPWQHWWRHRFSDGQPTGIGPDDVAFSAFAYWYEGVPDYMEGANSKNTGDGTYRTVLAFGGGYMSAPDPEVYDDQGIWRLVETYTNSGESECPGRSDIPPGSKAGAVGIVEGDDEIIQCGLCEEPRGAEHGHIYIGEGYEAVYVLDEELTFPEHERRLFVVLDIMVPAGSHYHDESNAIQSLLTTDQGYDWQPSSVEVYESLGELVNDLVRVRR